MTDGDEPKDERIGIHWPPGQGPPPGGKGLVYGITAEIDLDTGKGRIVAPDVMTGTTRISALSIVDKMATKRTRYRARLLGRYLAIIIKQMMRAENCTQNELARRAGLGKYLLAQWVHGVTHPGPANREKLHLHLCAKPERMDACILADKLLFFLDGEKADLDAAEKALAQLRGER